MSRHETEILNCEESLIFVNSIFNKSRKIEVKNTINELEVARIFYNFYSDSKASALWLRLSQ
jgi:hypothetical protein